KKIKKIKKIKTTISLLTSFFFKIKYGLIKDKSTVNNKFKSGKLSRGPASSINKQIKVKNFIKLYNYYCLTY
ncbi:hypothetical protein, partial [Colwellia sp. MB02u-6]|uniref:hypothetical protein n=1 Tax=Colwellia sp. MB02u-6 TaxID=2759824 RepID=UPI001C716A21